MIYEILFVQLIKKRKRPYNSFIHILFILKIDLINELQYVIMEQSDKKDEFYNVFTSCLDILRDNEGLTGEKALRNTTYLLILKLLEPHFKDTINIDDYEYDFSDIEDDMVELHKTKLLKMVRFTNLAKEKEDDIPNIMKYLWDDILSKHPSTKNIFLKNKGFDIKHKSTYKKIIEKFVKINLSVEQDHLGNSYEAVIKQIMTGKVLGQFFTPPQVKKMMVDLIDPQVKEDGTIDTCGDPTMGTGGFLITFLQKIIQQAKDKDIKLDWDFIKTKGLYGKEKEPDTYQLAVSNMLISTGHMFEHLDCGDSIREPITRKFDNILANPPFGITGLKYNDFQSSLKSVYVPIKSDNAVSLFIQAIIYMLNLGGKCAIVLPDGQDLFSKSNKKLVHIREYLLKTCDLNEIIYLPSGVFTYTSIKTCIFFFVKKKEGNDVLETKIKYSKTQTETGREYTFSKIHQTTNVKFYDYIGDVKNLLVEVPIEKIVSNSYSLNYAEYMEHKEDQYEEGVVVKTLGEVCKFLPKSKRNAKYGKDEGLYPFIKSSMIVKKYVDEPDYEEESLIIGDGGEPNINYGLKFSTSDHCYILQNKNKTILNLKYSYYYLFHNLDMMDKLYIGVAIKNISKSNISDIKIPIPPIEKQQEIVKYLDFIYEKANKTSQEKIKELKQLNESCLNMQKMFGDNVVKTLGEVCEIQNGKRITKSKDEGSEYFAYGGGDLMSYKVNEYNRDGITYKISRDGLSKHNCITKLYGKLFLNDTALTLDTLDDKSVNNYYIGEFLLSQKKYIYDNCTHGTAQLHIDINNLMKLKIPIPSIERQKEIVDYCEYNDTLIQQLEKEIEHNKKQAQLFMTSIVKEISV